MNGWLLLSVLVASLAALGWKLLDLKQTQMRVLPQLDGLLKRADFLAGQLGETQRAVVKVDNRLTKLAQAIGQHLPPTEMPKA